MLYLIPLLAALVAAAPTAILPVARDNAVAVPDVGSLNLGEVLAAGIPVDIQQAVRDSISRALASAGQAPPERRDLGYIHDLIEDAKDKAHSAVPDIIEGIKDAVDGVKDATKDKVEAKKEAFGQLLQDKVDALEAKICALKESKEKVGEAIYGALEAEIQWVKDNIAAKKDFLDSKIDAKKEFLESTIGKLIEKKIQLIEDKIDAIVNFFHGGGDEGDDKEEFRDSK